MNNDIKRHRERERWSKREAWSLFAPLIRLTQRHIQYFVPDVRWKRYTIRSQGSLNLLKERDEGWIERCFFFSLLSFTLAFTPMSTCHLPKPSKFTKAAKMKSSSSPSSLSCFVPFNTPHYVSTHLSYLSTCFPFFFSLLYQSVSSQCLALLCFPICRP